MTSSFLHAFWDKQKSCAAGILGLVRGADLFNARMVLLRKLPHSLIPGSDERDCRVLRKVEAVLLVKLYRVHSPDLDAPD